MVFQKFDPQIINSFSRTAKIAEKKIVEIAEDNLLNHKVDLDSD